MIISCAYTIYNLTLLQKNSFYNYESLFLINDLHHFVSQDILFTRLFILKGV